MTIDLSAVRAGGAILLALTPAGAREEDLALLDAAERERAARQRDATARAGFVAGRALLRRGLSLLAPGAPQDWRLALDAARRPALAPGQIDGLVFSLAHCAGGVGCAFALGGRIGLDLEDEPDEAAIAAAARLTLSAAERAALAGLDGAPRRAAFLAFWTGKEALLKGMGEGFLRDPAGVTIDLTEAPARPILAGAAPGDEAWAIRLWSGPPAGALADDRGRPHIAVNWRPGEGFHMTTAGESLAKAAGIASRLARP